MKWFFGILVSLAVAVVLAAKFYVPNRFHQFVHKELLKDVTDGKVYKVVNGSTHQTIITSDKNITTITSVTELNPLKNYVLIDNKDVLDPTKNVSAKVTYEIVDNKDVRLNVLFNDIDQPKISIIKPLLTLTTPIKLGLIKNDSLKLYLASHVKLAFSVEKLKYSAEKAVSEFSQGLLSIASQPSADPNVFSIVGNLSIKEMNTVITDNSVSEKFSDVENVLTIESFKISGLQSLFKKDDTAAGGTPDMPMAMKAMGLIPKLESMATIPFKITIASNATHASGKTPMNFELDIKDANIMQPGAFLLKASLSFPYDLLKEHVLDMMSPTLAQIQGKDFSHPDFSDANRPQGDITLALKFDREKFAKLADTFKEFLNQTNEAKQTKTEVLIEKAVAMGLLKKEGSIYSAEFRMENMAFSVNGKADFKEELAQAIPQAEIDTFLVSKGYVSLVALANGPKKNCHTLLPGFPKTNGTLLPKEACVSNCEGLLAFCLTNPNEKHLCYLYQCTWDAEVLSFKNTAPVPAEKALITKHLNEVKAKLKALQRIK